MVFKEETLSSEYVYKGKIINVRKDKVTTVSGTSTREVVEHPEAVVVLALKQNGKVIMEKQFRKPIEGVVFELPAGKVDEGEKPEHAALRELREETGFRTTDIKYLTKMYTSVGFTDEVIYAYLCTGLNSGETDMDEHEAIDSEEYDLDQLVNMVMSGEITDAKTQVAVLMVKRMIEMGELKEYLVK